MMLARRGHPEVRTRLACELRLSLLRTIHRLDQVKNSRLFEF